MNNALHILCFGNSITAGWTELGVQWHPYAMSLLDGLGRLVPSTDFTADIQGAPGDRVVSPPGGYLPRMDILYAETQVPYDWAIILGGTNDIATLGDAAEIWEGLKKVYAIPLSHNSKVLALTIPESEGHNDIQVARRDWVNEKILNYKADNFYAFDLLTAFPYWNLTDERRQEMWHDGTHPSDAGYDVIGGLLADRLAGLISKSEDEQEHAQVPLRNGLRRRRSERGQNRVEGRVLRSGRVVA